MLYGGNDVKITTLQREGNVPVKGEEGEG